MGGTSLATLPQETNHPRALPVFHEGEALLEKQNILVVRLPACDTCPLGKRSQVARPQPKRRPTGRFFVAKISLFSFGSLCRIISVVNRRNH